MHLCVCHTIEIHYYDHPLMKPNLYIMLIAAAELKYKVRDTL